jgi:hypothetical protein
LPGGHKGVGGQRFVTLQQQGVPGRPLQEEQKKKWIVCKSKDEKQICVWWQCSKSNIKSKDEKQICSDQFSAHPNLYWYTLMVNAPSDSTSTTNMYHAHRLYVPSVGVTVFASLVGVRCFPHAGFRLKTAKQQQLPRKDQ